MERETEPKAAAKCAERIEELNAARDYAAEHGLVPSETAGNASRSADAARWQYEPRGRQNGSQRAAQGSSAARQRDNERRQEGRSR